MPQRNDHIIAREGWIFIVLTLIPALVLWVLKQPYLSGVFFLLTVFNLAFFRNPRRKVVNRPGVVVAPADGKIIAVEEVREGVFLQDRAMKISIFLNLFDVHINRMPVTGTVSMQEKVGGRFLPAHKREASQQNSRNYIGLETEWGRVLVVQITGLIARRIISWVEPGDTLQTGDRLGLIRYGSCTEIYLPCAAEILVQPGQTVRGGVTEIAQFCD